MSWGRRRGTPRPNGPRAVSRTALDAQLTAEQLAGTRMTEQLAEWDRRPATSLEIEELALVEDHRRRQLMGELLLSIDSKDERRELIMWALRRFVDAPTAPSRLGPRTQPPPRGPLVDIDALRKASGDLSGVDDGEQPQVVEVPQLVSPCSAAVEVTRLGRVEPEWACTAPTHQHPPDALIVPAGQVYEHRPELPRRTRTAAPVCGICGNPNDLEMTRVRRGSVVGFLAVCPVCAADHAAPEPEDPPP